MQDGVDLALPADLPGEGEDAVPGRADLFGDILAKCRPGPGLRRTQGHVQDGPALRGVHRLAGEQGLAGGWKIGGSDQVQGAGKAGLRPGLLGQVEGQAAGLEGQDPDPVGLDVEEPPQGRVCSRRSGQRLPGIGHGAHPLAASFTARATMSGVRSWDRIFGSPPPAG